MSKKLWEASQSIKFSSNLYSFEQHISKKYSKKFNQNYSSILKWSISNPGKFWDSDGIIVVLMDKRVKKN